MGSLLGHQRGVRALGSCPCRLAGTPFPHPTTAAATGPSPVQTPQGFLDSLRLADVEASDATPAAAMAGRQLMSGDERG